MSERIETRLEQVRTQGRAALIPYIAAGDPDFDTCRQILKALPQAGADMIELGVPFTDPMADGREIQLASQRSLAQGHAMRAYWQLVQDFRADDHVTPLIAMTYYNPVLSLGLDAFVRQCADCGIDGIIAVDVPLEESEPLRSQMQPQGIRWVQLLSSTASPERLRALTAQAEGFLYYVAVNAPTGTKSVDIETAAKKVAQIRTLTALPIVSGFGIRTPEHVSRLATFVDGVVVGSAVVEQIRLHQHETTKDTVSAVQSYLKSLVPALKP